MADHSAAPVVSLEEVTVVYGKQAALRSVTAAFPRGAVGLLGPNGAGKTTSFRMVVGMIKPDLGEVMFAGETVTRMPMYRRARRGMGYLSQEPSVFKNMTSLDNILAVLEARKVPKKERLKIAHHLLADLQLTHLEDSLAGNLSGGERRRLEISRALATKPKLLLLDEPFAGVDPITVEEIQKILAQLSNRGIAILITDHAVEATLRIAGRAYILDHGTVIAEGSPQQVIANETVRSVYLGASFGEGVTGDEGEALGLD
ncbi:MAG: LPS export ABC transporter ATP-binding protein [Planctomycetota bacterium]|nr:LPS export ABC transporter ATP-binding protein [Planctomycetota bacterium]